MFEGGDAFGDVRWRIGDGLERGELFDSIVAGDGGRTGSVETWRAMVGDVIFEAIAAMHPNLVGVGATLAEFHCGWLMVSGWHREYQGLDAVASRHGGRRGVGYHAMIGCR